jgi:HEAT repeat protein
MIPLGFFAGQCLRDSGAPTVRRARQLARRLAARADWPANIADCRALPEVKALRDALHIDASPALVLLSHPRPEVRVGALAALEFRQNWRHGQPEIILQYAQRAQEPEVRAAAVNALGNLESRLIVEGLAEFLRDPSPLVRQTATEALLWNTEGRWAWIRNAVRQALADPATHEDGPLRLGGNVLTAEAVTDLTAWAAEKGGGAIRAALTLGEHYALALAGEPDPKLVAELRRQLLDVRTPAVLRYELAKLLHQHGELDDEVLRQLLSSTTPAPVRLLAADSLLVAGPCPEAVTALQELARLPNREIALSTADVVQRRLGEDLGLPRGQALPPVQSRQAAEVARRVLIWSTTPAQPTPEAAPAQ